MVALFRHRGATLFALTFFIMAAVIVAPRGVSAKDPFAAFVGDLRSACARPPAALCAVTVKAFLDRDGSGRVEIDELKQARRRAQLALRTKQAPLTVFERNLIAVGLMIVNRAGIEKVFAGFDTNRDGGLDDNEMFADFRMDNRSFRAIVKDPKSADWKSFAGRFGKIGGLITSLIPKPVKP